MLAGYFVQACKAKGARLLGQPTEGYAFADDAMTAARRFALWRAGIAVFGQAVDGHDIQSGMPTVFAVHGQVPDGWLTADRTAA